MSTCGDEVPPLHLQPACGTLVFDWFYFERLLSVVLVEGPQAGNLAASLCVLHTEMAQSR